MINLAPFLWKGQPSIARRGWLRFCWIVVVGFLYADFSHTTFPVAQDDDMRCKFLYKRGLGCSVYFAPPPSLLKFESREG